MIILEDTRQQAGKHDLKHKWFAEHGIFVNRCTLVCGDYQIPGDGSVAVDSKKDIAELIGDIQVRQMPKKEIRQNLDNLFPELDAFNLYSLIGDDDSDRFPENEISDYCFKRNLPESWMKAAQDLYLKRHGFFHRGLIRAKQYGVKLYILVENEDGVKSIEDLFRWINPRSQIFVRSNIVRGYYKNGNPIYQRVQKYPNCMKGQQLAKACLTMEKKYGCQFVFCKPKEAGQKIVELLGGDGDG